MKGIKIQEIDINKIIENPDNPRVIKDEKFKELVKSITDFPQMLWLRPIVLNEDSMALGGNQRTKACKEAGMKKVPVIFAKDLTEDQQKEFIIKDNVSFGEWDWDQVKDWDEVSIGEWGLDIPEFITVSGHDRSAETKREYSKKIKAPVYEPKNEKPSEGSLVDATKTLELLAKIDSSDLDDEVRDFLRASAMRHTVFNYEKIADFYAHSPKEIQELMEESALVIIDFGKAIEGGFVQLSTAMIDQYKTDYDEK